MVRKAKEGQGTLFPDEPTIDEKFAAFHEANPGVYLLFKRFANEARRKNARGSADMILHRVRWETTVVTTDQIEGGVRLNNNWTSRYARMLIAEDPSYWGSFFETRKIRTR